jgi:rhodanese-related sulfurtransferase
VTARSVDPREARRLAARAGYEIVDVRTESEYADGHPPGAVNVPFVVQTRQGRAPNVDFLPVMQAVFPTQAKLVVSSHTGRRAALACDLLRAAGYESVLELEAGYAGWTAEALPTETISEGRSYPDMRWRAFELRA